MINSQKKIYIVAITSGIINLVLIILVILPLLKTIENNSQALLSQKGELLLLKQRKENLENLKKVSETQRENLEKIEHTFVNPEIPIDFIRFLEKTALDSRTSIKISLASEKEEETDFGPTLSFNISLESSFPNFLKFLEKLENAPYLIEILNLNIERLGGETPGNISAALSIRTLTK